MNKKNWKPGNFAITKQVYFNKLGEEFGEVAKEMAEHDQLLAKRSKLNVENLKKNNERLVSELEHVEFIARQFRKSIERLYEEVSDGKAKAKK